MGNYYNGELRLVLKKTVPLNILCAILSFIHFPKDIEELKENIVEERLVKLRERFPKESLFQSNILSCLNVEVGVNFPKKSSGYNLYCAQNLSYFLSYIAAGKTGNRTQRKIEIYYNSKKFNFENLTLSQCIDAFKKNIDLVQSIVVCVQVNAKEYNNELLDFLNFLRPYLILNHRESVGYIQNEDGTVCKELFLNSLEYEKMKMQCKNICKDCERYNKDVDCSYFKYCKNAFIRGQKSVEILGPKA